MRIKKAAHAIRRVAKEASRVIPKVSKWMIFPKIGEAAMKVVGTCLDAVLHIPLTEVELSGHRKILIQTRLKSKATIERRNPSRLEAWSGVRLSVMWDSMRNVDWVVAECPRTDHTCPNLIRWYVMLLRRLAQHPDAADSSRIWAAKILLDRENSGMDERL